MDYEACSSIEAVSPEWKILQEEGKSSVFQTIEWVSYWTSVVGIEQEIEPLIVVARSRGKKLPSLIVPFGIRTVFGVRIMSVLGGFHADYSGAVVQGEQNNHADVLFWEETGKIARAKKIDVIWVHNIPSFVEGVANPLWSPECIRSGEANSIIWSQPWSEYSQELVHVRIRPDSRRQRKRLSEIGKLRFYIPESDEGKKTFAEIMIDQKEQRYRAMGIKNQFDRPENREFYIGAIRRENEFKPHVSALMLEDDVLAVHWGEVYKGRFYYLMPSHAEKWAKYSPGRLLLENLLEWSFSSGYTNFDFTVGDEAYKYQWANLGIPLFEYKKALTMKGSAYLAMRDFYRRYIHSGSKETGRKVKDWKS